MEKVYLVLEDGQIFPGQSFGAAVDGLGELVFTTGMCGYIETLTDPSYSGQIVMQTYPLIGNYGIIEEDFEGQCAVRGYVVREWCLEPSNFRAQYSVDAFLKARGVPGVCGVDTRQLTRVIREHGVMNAMICREIPQDLTALQAYAINGAVARVSREEPLLLPAQGEQRFRVALLDYGVKANIYRSLCRKGCAVDLLPASVSAQTVLAGGYDGLVLSNGPGDPAENSWQIQQLARLLGRLPLMGICLGHQLTALAAGGRTYKLKYGHRGANQPVRDLLGSRTYITSQNHGYAVDADSLPQARPSYINANDQSCEGLDYPDLQAFTVQFHPEARGGPQDTSFLFDRFINMMCGCDMGKEGGGR